MNKKYHAILVGNKKGIIISREDFENVKKYAGTNIMLLGVNNEESVINMKKIISITEIKE